VRPFALALLVTVGLPACSRPAGPPPGSRTGATVTAAAPSSAPAAEVAVARIVFVGKEHACDCTRKAIDASWQALEAALGLQNRIPVERLHSDTQEDKVVPYRAKKPFLALPAIYLLDGTDSLIEMLQGEITEAQLRPHLAGAAAIAGQNQVPKREPR
jgi:hypothetical protein